MPAKVRITTVIALLVLPFALLQGCGSSSSDSPSSTAAQGLNLEMSSANDVTVLLADGLSSVQIQMKVATQSGRALANTPVTFSTTAGTLSAVPGTNVITNAHANAVPRQAAEGEITIGTDADGIALIMLTSSNTVETAVVSAEVNGFKQSITIDFISGFPTALKLKSTVNLVAQGDTSTLVATVTDEQGDPLAGVTVNFQLAVSVSEGASLSPTSSRTDANGRAQTTYQAGTTSGTDTIQATVSTVATSNTTGGGSISATTSIVVQEEVVGNVASDIQLLVSSPQLDSDGLEEVTLTALVRDSNNNLIPDVHVTFGTEDSAAIQVIRETTDEAGTAEAKLRTGGDPTNRTITVQATAGILVSENTVQVSGTTITFSGNNSLAHDETAELSILLRDSSGAGIADQPVTLTSMAGNASINNGGGNGEVTTGFNGQATFDVTVADSGTYTIQASALGATATFDVTVNASDFTFETPEELTEVPLSPNATVCAPPTTPQMNQTVGCINVSIHFEQDGVPLEGNGALIEFTTTRGSFASPAIVAPVGGSASTVIRANNAGFAMITAICRDPNPDIAGDICDGEPTIQRIIEFVATAADSINLTADPASIGVNTDGLTNEQSTITAVVRDASNNLVKNKRIDFTLDDITGGTINPAFAITDSFGRASTVYTSGSVSSSSGGVIVTAVVNDTPTVTESVALTVADKALFIKIGTANVIFEEDDVLYRYPYSVIVTDSSGNSVPGVVVELSVTSTTYQKGTYVWIDPSWNKNVQATCPNEDTNGNGILDPGEDLNGNGTLEPGEVASVTDVVVTDDNGIGLFDLRYAQEFTWVQVRLTARAVVAGTESSSSATFFLTGAASDFNSEDKVPPGQFSPFGTQPGCYNTN